MRRLTLGMRKIRRLLEITVDVSARCGHSAFTGEGLAQSDNRGITQMTTTQKLEALRNYSTRYEVALSFADGRKMLVCYTPRKNKSGLLDAIQGRGKAILAQMPDLSDDARLTYKAATGFDFGNGTRAHFTGRTQRDAICNGEMDFIGA